MTFGRIALLLAAATALEFLVGGSRHRGLLPVDWFLLATASVSRGGNFVRAVLTGAAAGFVEDAFSQQLFGMNAFAKAAIGYGLAMISVADRLRRRARGRGGAGRGLARQRPDRGRARRAAAAGAGRARIARGPRARGGDGRRGRACSTPRSAFPGANGGKSGSCGSCGETMLKVRDDRRLLGRRIEGARVAAGAAFALLATAYWYIQISRGEYYFGLSENNRLRSVKVMAPRGYVLDRNGSVLVENEPAYNLQLYRREAKDIGSAIDLAAGVLQAPREQVQARVRRGLRDPEFLPIPIAENLGIEEVASIEARAPEHPEFFITVSQRRLYKRGVSAAHALGIPLRGEPRADRQGRRDDVSRGRLGGAEGHRGVVREAAVGHARRAPRHRGLPRP